MLTAQPKPQTWSGNFAASRILRIEFEQGSNPTSYVQQVMSRLSEDLYSTRKITGFVVNYTPDRAVKFDVEGQEVAVLKEATSFGKWMFGNGELCS